MRSIDKVNQCVHTFKYFGYLSYSSIFNNHDVHEVRSLISLRKLPRVGCAKIIVNVALYFFVMQHYYNISINFKTIFLMVPDLAHDPSSSEYQIMS